MIKKELRIIQNYEDFGNFIAGDLISINGGELVVDPIEDLRFDRGGDNSNIYTLFINGKFVVESKYMKYSDTPFPEWEEEYLTPLVKSSFQINDSEDCKINVDFRLEVLKKGGLIK